MATKTYPHKTELQKNLSQDNISKALNTTQHKVSYWKRNRQEYDGVKRVLKAEKATKTVKNKAKETAVKKKTVKK